MSAGKQPEATFTGEPNIDIERGPRRLGRPLCLVHNSGLQIVYSCYCSGGRHMNRTHVPASKSS